MPPSPHTQHEWTIHSLNIHGIFFERWCQQIVDAAPGWRLDATNYPVEFPPPNGPFRGRESALDLRASHDSPGLQLSLLIECKKNNPEFVDWVFFEKLQKKSQSPFYVSENRNTGRAPPATGWDCTSSIRGLISTYAVTDEARETRSNYLEWKNTGAKTKTSNSAIQDAAYQISLATQAVVHEDDTMSRRLASFGPDPSMPWQKKLYFPTIVTTAKLFVCRFSPDDVAPETGELPFGKAMVSQVQALVFEYPLPRHLQFAPQDIRANFSEGIAELFTRLHILVVHSAHFPEFLRTFYQHESPTPASVPSPEIGGDA